MQVDTDIAFDWGAGGEPVSGKKMGANGWSGRWTGYVRPEYSDSYTFSVLSDGGATLSIDGVRIVDNLNATAVGPEVSGTVVLTGGVWYDLQVEYVPALAELGRGAKLQLWWKSPQQEKQLVPGSRLRTSAALVGPESATGQPNGGYNLLEVHPTVVCATASDIRGAGLSIATAGVSASFTVWSKDMYGNLRDDTNDMLVARMFPDDATAETGITYQGTGLQATYYERIGLTEPKHAASKGSVVDFDDRFTLHKYQFNDVNNDASLVSLAKGEVFSARWMGLVRPSTAGTYTFHLGMTAATEERVKLWVGNQLLIDEWESLSAVKPKGVFTVGAANQVYPIRIAYKNPLTSATAKLQLKWEASGITEETITTNFLYPCQHASALNSNGASCDSDSKIQTQTTDDSNAKLNFGDDASSTAFGMRRLTPTTAGLAPERAGPYTTSFAAFNGNRHPFSYVQTRAGSHTIAAHEVAYKDYDGTDSFATTVGAGLMATYYETDAFGTPRNAYDCQAGRGGCTAGSGATGTVTITTSGLVTPASLIADGIFSVRWAGMVRAPGTTQMVTFRAKVGSSTAKDERVKLWVDNSLIIDQWASLAATVADAARQQLTPNQLYDIKVEYKNVVAGSADGSQLSLMAAWNSQVSDPCENASCAHARTRLTCTNSYTCV